MAGRYGSNKIQSALEADLDELLRGLCAISIAAQHMAEQVNEIKEIVGGQEDEQNVRIRCCCQRAPQMR